MPVYEYECKKCHRQFEYTQRMNDPEMTVCESCGGELSRIISRTAFQLKGSGWYKDLYGSGRPPDANAQKLAPGLAPPIGAHEGPPTTAELTGTSVTSDGKSASDPGKSSGSGGSTGSSGSSGSDKSGGGSSGGGSTSGSGGGGSSGSGGGGSSE